MARLLWSQLNIVFLTRLSHTHATPDTQLSCMPRRAGDDSPDPIAGRFVNWQEIDSHISYSWSRSQVRRSVLLLNMDQKGDVSDVAQNSILSRSLCSLHSFLCFRRASAPVGCCAQRCDRETRSRAAGSGLDLWGLLDSVSDWSVPRCLSRPAVQLLHLPRLWHDWQSHPREMQPNQRSDARARVLVLVVSLDHLLV